VARFVCDIAALARVQFALHVLAPATRRPPGFAGELTLASAQKQERDRHAVLGGGLVIDAGGGTRTPDTRITIPLHLGLGIGRSGVVGHGVGHNRASG
jgi:hypothetical protein